MAEILVKEIAVISIYMTLLFLYAQAINRNDIADVAWGTGFIVIALTTGISVDNISAKGFMTIGLVTLWGVRLALHIYARNRGKPEDRRYRKWKEDWGRHAVVRAFFQVFLFQGILMVIVSLPVTYIIISDSGSIGVLDMIGLAVWSVGFFFEALGDYQLMRHRQTHAGKRVLMSRGLWAYTRHPNYFGEVTLWWGIYIIALSIPSGWMTILGPLTITVLILKVSGIPLLEDKYKDNPEFQAYKRRTSAFFPLPPKKEA